MKLVDRLSGKRCSVDDLVCDGLCSHIIRVHQIKLCINFAELWLMASTLPFPKCHKFDVLVLRSADTPTSPKGVLSKCDSHRGASRPGIEVMPGIKVMPCHLAPLPAQKDFCRSAIHVETSPSKRCQISKWCQPGLHGVCVAFYSLSSGTSGLCMTDTGTSHVQKLGHIRM